MSYFVLPSHLRIEAETLIGRVCNARGITREEIASRSRTPKICHPRMLAMYLVRENTALSLLAIGELFGGRDHGTVLNACKRVREWIENTTGLQDLINSLVKGEDQNQTKLKL